MRTLNQFDFSQLFLFSIEIASPKKTFLKCNLPFHIRTPKNFKKKTCNGYKIYYTRLNDSIPSSLSGCSIIQLPKNLSIGPWPDDYNLFGILSSEFELGVYISDECDRCYNRGGQCKTSHNRKFYCDGAEKGIYRTRKNTIILGNTLMNIHMNFSVLLLFLFIHYYKFLSFTFMLIYFVYLKIWLMLLFVL
jgi:hypothetical protein